MLYIYLYNSKKRESANSGENADASRTEVVSQIIYIIFRSSLYNLQTVANFIIVGHAFLFPPPSVSSREKPVVNRVKETF